MNNESKVPTGPEDIPLKEIVKTMMIAVSVYDLKTDKVIREEIVDYGDFKIRKWLGRLTYTAIANGWSVETMSKEDWEKHNKE